MSCLGEHVQETESELFSMIWYDAWESYFDLMSAATLSNPCPAFRDIHERRLLILY